MEEATGGSGHITWDPHLRLATRWQVGDAAPTADDARMMIDALSGWIGTDRKPFGILVKGLGSVTPGSRAAWRAFIWEHRNEVRVAFCGAPPAFRVVIGMFVLAWGVPLRAFSDVDEARAWLLRGLPPPVE
jgi:hypothetical protein